MRAIKHHDTKFPQLRKRFRTSRRVALHANKYAPYIDMDTLALALRFLLVAFLFSIFLNLGRLITPESKSFSGNR